MYKLKLLIDIVRYLAPVVVTKQGLVILGLIWIMAGGVEGFISQFKGKPNIAIKIEGSHERCTGQVVKDYQDFPKGSYVGLPTELCLAGHRSGYLTYSSNTGYRPVGTGWINPFRNEKSTFRAAGQIELMLPGKVMVTDGTYYSTSGIGRDCLGKIALINTFDEVRSCQ